MTRETLEIAIAILALAVAVISMIIQIVDFYKKKKRDDHDQKPPVNIQIITNAGSGKQSVSEVSGNSPPSD